MAETLEVTGESKPAFCPRVKVTLSATLAPKQYHSLKAEAEICADVPDLLNENASRDIAVALARAVEMAEREIAKQLGVKYEEMKEQTE